MHEPSARGLQWGPVIAAEGTNPRATKGNVTMKTAFALAAASFVVVSSSSALANDCFDRLVYEAARVTQVGVPDERERAEMEDQALAAAYADVEVAVLAFLATEDDRTCDEAAPAQARFQGLMDVIVANGGFQKGLCCTHWNTDIGGTGTCTPADGPNGKSCISSTLFYCDLKGNECF
jgi:hypothetical protein